MLSGTVAYPQSESPGPSPPPFGPKCLSFDGIQWNYLPCGWTTDGKRWTPPPPPPPDP